MAVRRRSQQRAEEALSDTLAGAPVQGARRLRRATKTGAWLKVQPYTVNGTDLGAQEWRDALFLWYGLDPPDFTKYCNDCNAKFTICHTLDCKRGSLYTARRNELQDRVADLDGKAFTPSNVATPSSFQVALWRGWRLSHPRLVAHQTETARRR